MDDADRQATIAALVTELTNARRRGLDELDLDTGRQVPVATPELERLARTYTRDMESPRVPLIRRFIDNGLQAWAERGHATESEFVRRLFFPAEAGASGPRRPGELLKAVRTSENLSEDLLDDRRRAYFEQLAGFLMDFATAGRSHRWRWAIVAGGAALAVVGIIVALLVSAGGSGTAGSTRSRNSSGSSSASSASSSAPPRGAPITLRFDALGGTTSKIINVYPGVGTSARDRKPNGTFSDGQSAPALCKTIGRRISSDVSGGERPRTSTIWIRVQGSPGLVQYATLVYADVGHGDLARLPRCH